jgi:hypothetical protein
MNITGVIRLNKDKKLTDPRDIAFTYDPVMNMVLIPV